MLEWIRLQNFQRHRRLVVNFDPATTTIIGHTEAGKSAVARALEWVALNPVMDPAIYRTHGSKRTQVVIRIDGHTIARRRSDTVNEYVLDGHVYKAFGTTVPPAIVDLLRLTQHNFQLQLDDPYWITESPGQLGKNLNAIVNLSAIDSTLGNIGRKHREATAAVKVIEARVDEAKAQSKATRYLVALDEELEELEALHTEATVAALAAADAAALAKAARQQYRAVQRYAKAVAAGVAAVGAGQQWQAASSNHNSLAQLIKEAEQARRTAAAKLPPWQPVQTAQQAHTAAIKAAKEAQALVNELERAKWYLEQNQGASEAKQREFVELQKKLKVCPVCNQPLKIQS